MTQIATLNPTLCGLDAMQVWDTDLAFQQLRLAGLADTKRTAERRINSLGIWPEALAPENLNDELERPLRYKVLRFAIEQARRKREKVLFAQLYPLPGGQPCIHANDARGARFWVPMAGIAPEQIFSALKQLQTFIGKNLALFGHGELVGTLRNLPSSDTARMYPAVYQPVLPLPRSHEGYTPTRVPLSVHLKRLESESIHIIREALAHARRPVMFYSMGKDSSVMLHLARKAFYPALPPFPLLHIDTRWKFQEMYQWRNHVAEQSGMKLLVHTNPEAVEKDINPFDHGSGVHTEITKTKGLKQALDAYQFDVALCGVRRDEEKSCSKERIFSFRNVAHHWDPLHQDPEISGLYNTRKSAGESLRVFPLANWTEVDIWHYLYCERLPVASLYFARERPVVIRDDAVLMVDDDRFQLLPDEQMEFRKVRFRSLGCYPLTSAVESEAENIAQVLLELTTVPQSERDGRKIDTDDAFSMERKRREGYF